MTITLNDELEDLINEKIKSGEYKSADEVIAASLRLLKAKEEGMEALRREIMSEALEKLAGINALSDISDPSAWQREQRRDRTLPDRDA